MKFKKKIIAISLLLLSVFVLTACEDDEQTDNDLTKTEGLIDKKSTSKPIKAKKTPMHNISVSHELSFNGKKIPLTATYGIDKHYVNNWWFTDNEEINLSIKPDKDVAGLSFGVNNVYSDVVIASSYIRFNGVRQDSVNQSYSNLPAGYVAIDKANDFDLPFQVESINENQTSFYMINGYGSSDTERISEKEIRQYAYGAKLNVVWTIAIKYQGQTYFKTIHDTIGLPYKVERVNN